MSKQPGLVTVPRPQPSDLAQQGLHKLTSMTVEFNGQATDAEECAAIDHLNELIRWWQLSGGWVRAGDPIGHVNPVG